MLKSRAFTPLDTLGSVNHPAGVRSTPTWNRFCQAGWAQIEIWGIYRNCLKQIFSLVDVEYSHRICMPWTGLDKTNGFVCFHVTCGVLLVWWRHLWFLCHLPKHAKAWKVVLQSGNRPLKWLGEHRLVRLKTYFHVLPKFSCKAWVESKHDEIFLKVLKDFIACLLYRSTYTLSSVRLFAHYAWIIVSFLPDRLFWRVFTSPH